MDMTEPAEAQPGVPPGAKSNPLAYGAEKATQKHTFPLAPFAGEKPPAPDWFTQALAAPRTDGAVESAGAKIAWRRWDTPGRAPDKARGLIFVHGGLAHLGWWDFIAPFFADAWTPLALSLSGMGASDHRSEYAADVFADEILAAAEAAGIDMADTDNQPIVVGHSFGAMVSSWAAGRHGDRLAGVVVVDIPLVPPKPDEVEGDDTRSRRGGRVYPTMAAALARFRLMPNQECEHLFIVDHVAREAIMPVAAEDNDGEAGFTWRHDPELWLKRKKGEKFNPEDVLAAVRCPLAFIRGAQSKLVPDELWAQMGEYLPADMPLITVPEAQHHVLLDQPLAMVAGLHGLLSVWPKPHRGGVLDGARS